MAPRKPRKSARQIEREIAIALPSLADRARAKEFEPETIEGGRAMLQSLTLADIQRVKPLGEVIPTGTQVTFTMHTLGGSHERKGVVAWDDGRGNVDIRITRGGWPAVVRATKTATGSLYASE